MGGGLGAVVWGRGQTVKCHRFKLHNLSTAVPLMCLPIYIADRPGWFVKASLPLTPSLHSPHIGCLPPSVPGRAQQGYGAQGASGPSPGRGIRIRLPLLGPRCPSEWADPQLAPTSPQTRLVLLLIG